MSSKVPLNVLFMLLADNLNWAKVSSKAAHVADQLTINDHLCISF